MKGRNTLELNQATLQLVVQQWVDRTFPKPAPMVVGIEVVREGGVARYAIRLETHEGAGE